MRPISERLLRLTLAVIASISIIGSLSAQEAAPPRSRDASAPASKSEPDRKASTTRGDAALGAKAERAAEARQRGWDRKMKAVGGRICRGC